MIKIIKITNLQINGPIKLLSDEEREGGVAAYLDIPVFWMNHFVWIFGTSIFQDTSQQLILSVKSNIKKVVEIMGNPGVILLDYTSTIHSLSIHI